MDSLRAKSDMTTRLPPELLSRVFRCFGSLSRYPELLSPGLNVAERSITLSPGDEYITLGKSTYILDSSKCPARFKILLVCHRWRDVALADSSLWSDIDIDDPPSPLLCFLFEYSRTSSLMFSGWTQIPSPVVQGRTKTILDHLSRIKTLSFDFPDPGPADFSRMIEGLSSANVPRPVLKTLRLRWSAATVPQTIDIASLPSSISSIALHDVLPSVPFQCEGITSFHLVHAPLPWKCHLPGGLLDAIANLPSLESLHIGYRDGGEFKYPYTPLVEPDTRVSPVPLPHLCDFFFSGTPTHYAYIVPSLSFPTVASRNIELYENYEYDSGEVPEGWAPSDYQQYGHAVSPEVLREDRGYFLSDIDDILVSRRSGPGRDKETFGVHFSLLFVEGEYMLKVLVTPAPRRRLESSTFDDAVDIDDNNRPTPVLSIRYNVRPVDDDDVHLDEFEYERDIVHAIILPLISTISRMFPTDVVNHLHLSSNVSILLPTVEPESDDDSDTDENTEEWTPPFLEWSEVLSLHVEGKGMAEWLVPHVSKTRQLMFREGRKWRKETFPVVFPKLQELMLDKIDEGCYDEIWLHRWKVDVVEVGCWEIVLQARAACAGKKLQRLVVVGGEVWGQLEWRKWCAMLRTSGWIENNKIKWECDGTAGDPEDLLCDGTFTSEELDLMEEAWDYDWHRRICAGLCYSFCDRFLYT